MLVLVGLELLVIHGTISGSKIDSAFRNLLNTAAGTNRLIIDLQIRILLVVLIKPFGIHRIGESRPRTVDRQRIRPKDAGNTKYNQKDCCSPLHASLSPKREFCL